MIAVGVTLVTIGVSAAVASAGRLEVSIPGLSGPDVQVPSAQRTATGGAIIVAKIAARHGSRVGSTLTGQLQADGSLNLAYGNGGLATLTVSPGFRPTALAINPSTGEAWIGADSGDTSELVAVTGSGSPETRFGKQGVIYLPRKDDGGVVDLAWQPGRLLVSAGTGAACSGCEISLVSSISGATLASKRLASSTLGGATCTEAAVTSVVFTGSRRELVGARVDSRPGCSATVTALGPNLAPYAPSNAHPPIDPNQQLLSTTVASGAGATCVAGSNRHGISLSPYDATDAVRVRSSVPSSLIVLVALGDTACGALISRPGHDALVAQASSQNSRPSLSYLPAAIEPQTMFRCHAHLLTIGTSGPASARRAEIVPVPISRGPFVSSIDRTRSAAVATTTGCG